jgi:hypothetical protein
MGQISLAGQALAFHQLASNGIVTRTAANTVQARQILAGNGISGIAVGNGDGVSGSPSVALSGQALAVHQLASNGLITRTSAGNVSARTITGSNGVSIDNGDGVSANPNIKSSQTTEGVFYRDSAATGSFTALLSGADIPVFVAAAPAQSTAPGIKGQIAYDASGTYFYACTSTGSSVVNRWGRIALQLF